MNTNIKIEEDAIIKSIYGVTRMAQTLNEKGIYSIEDLLNADIDELFTSKATKSFYRVLKSIMKTRYQGAPFVYDVILKKNYTNSEFDDFIEDVKILGFNSRFTIYFDKYINKYGLITYDDLLSEISTGTNMQGILANLLYAYQKGQINVDEEVCNRKLELEEELRLLKLELQPILKKIEKVQQDLALLDRGEVIKHGK